MYLTDKIFKRYDHFEIDPAAIILHTLDEKGIKLPYSGQLPVQWEGAVNPYIWMHVSPCDVRVVLSADKGGKKLSASVEATPKEIDEILFRFFYKNGKDNSYHTKFNTGLSEFWLGYYQAEYDLWEGITLEGRAGDIALNLPYDKRVGLLKSLQMMERQRIEGEPA